MLELPFSLLSILACTCALPIQSMPSRFQPYKHRKCLVPRARLCEVFLTRLRLCSFLVKLQRTPKLIFSGDKPEGLLRKTECVSIGFLCLLLCLFKVVAAQISGRGKMDGPCRSRISQTSGHVINKPHLALFVKTTFTGL